MSTNIPKVVQMIPLRRCGSHALRLRMNMHPSFHSPYPLHPTDFNPTTTSIMKRYGELWHDHNYYNLVSDLCEFQSKSLVQWTDKDGNVASFNADHIFNALLAQTSMIRHPLSVINEMNVQIGALNSAEVVMDKSLDNVQWYEELLQINPDLLFINVVRDPRAQIASINRSIIHYFDTLLNTKLFLDRHAKAQQLIDKHPDKVITIKYEDFLSNEQMILNQLFGFLGLSNSSKLFDIYQSKEAKDLSTKSALWENNYSHPILQNIDKFKKHLDMKEIELIESMTFDFMKQYQYPFITSISAPNEIVITDEMIEMSINTSQKKEDEAWKELMGKDFEDYQTRKLRAKYLKSVLNRQDEISYAAVDLQKLSNVCQTHF